MGRPILEHAAKLYHTLWTSKLMIRPSQGPARLFPCNQTNNNILLTSSQGILFIVVQLGGYTAARTFHLRTGNSASSYQIFNSGLTRLSE